MLSALRARARALRDARRFNDLPIHERSIVLYAENEASWVHFAPIVTELTQRLDRRVCYLTSSLQDPVLHRNDERVRAFYIGAGSTRTYLFISLAADILVMTMPDLEVFFLKRSKTYPTHYVYLFHSMVSSHMIYRPQAFDHYDTILCVGPHHVEEVRARERLYDLPAKRLVEHGYGRLDSLLHRVDGAPASARCSTPNTPRVLVAPSWGPHGILETYGASLVDVLLRAGLHVTIRPHPMTLQKWPAAIAALRARIKAEPNAVLETDIGSEASLRQCDIMVSDWSGAALEYAFAFERPVLFIDVPRKVNNPEYERLGLTPIEVSIRDSIGEIVSADSLHTIPGHIDRLVAEVDARRPQIQAARAATVFHLGRSGAVAAAHIAALADDARRHNT